MMTECATIETLTSSSAGRSALRQSRIASTHDGQCRLAMKQVVLTTAGSVPGILLARAFGDMVFEGSLLDSLLVLASWLRVRASCVKKAVSWHQVEEVRFKCGYDELRKNE